MPAIHQDHYINELAKCFLQVPAENQARLYLLTFVFPRYRDHYFPFAASSNPTRRDVEAGMTRRLPAADRPNEFMGDVRRHYLRLLSGMFGRNRDRHRDYHPVGIGWLDEPVGKPNKTSKTTRYQMKRHPGDDFTHAHVLLQVKDYPSTPPLDLYEKCHFPFLVPELESSLITRFEYLDCSYALGFDWLRLNPSENLENLDGLNIRQIRSPADVPEVLDYCAKTAKRSRTLLDDMILLPFADPPERSKLN